MARNWTDVAPQTDAKTFALPSVSILLLWLQYVSIVNGVADLDGFSSVVHVTLQLHKQETWVCFPLPTQTVGTGQSLATLGQGYRCYRMVSSLGPIWAWGSFKLKWSCVFEYHLVLTSGNCWNLIMIRIKRWLKVPTVKILTMLGREGMKHCSRSGHFFGQISDFFLAKSCLKTLLIIHGF